MILSIIIPVYNVEKYIEKCLLSCLNQKDASKNDYEIIIINDGTKDKSIEIINKIKDTYTGDIPILVISQENQGLSVARNTGLQYAKGDYVWFVDSDDWIDDDSVKNIITELRKEEVDILQMPYKLIYENGKSAELEYVINIQSPISGHECMKITRLPNLAQSRICNRNFLNNNNLFFTRGILHEDAEFKPRLLWVAQKVKTLNMPCYNYLKRDKGSITAAFTMRNARGRWYGVKSMNDYSQEFSFKDKQLFNADINFNMYFILTGLKKLKKEDRKQIEDEIINNRKIFKRMILTLSPKKFIVYTLLYLNPKILLKFL